MKETHYIVRTPKHQLDSSKTKYFSSIKKAEQFISKELATIQKWYSNSSFTDPQDTQRQFQKSEAFRKFALVKPIAFEVEMQDFNWPVHYQPLRSNTDMGANTQVYVKVAKIVYEVIEVSAVTTEEALEEALKLPGVASAIKASYDREDLVWLVLNQSLYWSL